MTTARAISPPSLKSEDTFLSGDCQLYFSTGSLAAIIQLRNDNVINDDILRRVQRDLDLQLLHVRESSPQETKAFCYEMRAHFHRFFWHVKYGERLGRNSGLVAARSAGSSRVG